MRLEGWAAPPFETPPLISGLPEISTNMRMSGKPDLRAAPQDEAVLDFTQMKAFRARQRLIAQFR